MLLSLTCPALSMVLRMSVIYTVQVLGPIRWLAPWTSWTFAVRMFDFVCVGPHADIVDISCSEIGFTYVLNIRCSAVEVGPWTSRSFAQKFGLIDLWPHSDVTDICCLESGLTDAMVRPIQVDPGWS
jgi:hypothetical protein